MRKLNHGFGGFVLVLLAFSWVFASNHCTIASLAGGHREGSRSCCEKTAAAPCAESCCEALAAPVPPATSLQLPGVSLIACLPESLFSVLSEAVGEPLPSCASPPGWRISFFIQFVAGSCLQTAAPPAFVA